MSGNDILIFRTSIAKKRDVKNLRILFKQYPQIYSWNVDLEDWEKVLRVESRGVLATHLIDILRTIDIIASELE